MHHLSTEWPIQASDGEGGGRRGRENGPVVQLTGKGERTDRNKRKREEVRGVMGGEKTR